MSDKRLYSDAAKSLSQAIQKIGPFPDEYELSISTILNSTDELAIMTLSYCFDLSYVEGHWDNLGRRIEKIKSAQAKRTARNG